MMKRFLAISLCLIMLVAVLAGCNTQKDNTAEESTEAATEAVEAQATEAPATDDSSDPDAEDDLPELPDISGVLQDEITGTGTNAGVPLSITLFGTVYTPGKTTLQDMFDQDWGKDPESWQNIDMEAPIAKDEVGGTFLTIDKSTTEAIISYKNLAKESALPKACIITMIDFKGAPAGGLKKAGVKLFDSKLNLSELSSIDSLDQQLSEIFGTFKKGKLAVPVYNFYYYTVELDTGMVRIDVTQKKDSEEIISVNVQIDLAADYVYTE